MSDVHSATNNNGRRGLWIAFFGPDGAGKSAVIDELVLRVQPLFPEITQFHFRPMFRSRAIARPAVTEPHGQSPRGTFISLLKLLYWLLDCWFGYLITIRSALQQSGLVIFDRYYSDALVDPRRYRLPPSSLWLARLLVPLAPRPDLCILLDVPAEEVQQRKREVSPAESRRQRAAYLTMFQSLPNTLLVDAARPIEEVAQQVINATPAFFIRSSLEECEDSLLVNL